MRHTLRKYLSSRGSALFMVLSTMTALLIVVMAMYFSVVSSRSVQYAVFNREQSYQSSISVADAVIAGLNDGKLNTLSGEFFKLKVGETKSTNGNGFASLTGTGTKEDDPNIGAYDVTVTRLNDEGEYYVYDFVVTAMVNGVTETTHTLVRLSSGDPTPPPAGKTFTATGYLPNENWVGLGNYYDEVHIDSEYCVVGLDGATIFGNFTAAGSVEINNTTQSNYDGLYSIATYEAKHWSVGGNLQISQSMAGYGKMSEWLTNGTAEEHTTLIVGGNLIIENNGHLDIPQYVDIYVLGDCYVGTLSQNMAGNLFVGGTLYSVGDLYGSGVPIIITSNSAGYIYLSNSDDIDKYSVGGWGNPNIHIEAWGDTDETRCILSQSDAIDELNTAIGSNSYPKWIPEVDSDDVVDIAFNSYNNDSDAASMDRLDLNGRNVPKGRVVYEEEDLKFVKGSHESATIGNIYDLAPMHGAPGVNNYYIVIDTGDDPENVFTIRLLANRNLDPDENDVQAKSSNRTEKYDADELGENETFMWRPYDGTACNPEDASTLTYVLIKGAGTVVFDIPEGVTYQSTWSDFVGHMNWFALLADGTSNGLPVIGARDSMPKAVNKMVHKTCTGSHKCEYTQTKDGKKLEDGYWWCETHEYLVESTAATADELIEDGVCPCVNRVGRKEIASSFNLDSFTGDLVSRDSAGNFIYPTTNLWFVSCDENAQIRMAQTKNNDHIMYNTTFGFVYAPYMTFVAKSPSAEPGLRLAGGLIVSDLLLNDRYAYIYIAPEINYSELIGTNTDWLTPQGNRSWRKYGY